MPIGDRIKELRTKLKMTQTDLAIRVGLSYIQVGRYETQKSKPSSEILQKLATALETSTDYLISGSSYETVSAQLTDKELLSQFKEVEKLNKEDKYLIKTFIDAFITKRKVQNLAL
jgi:transcriptional regulator with XRE-family HTH domain